MILDELSRLERFRRVAQAHQVLASNSDLLPNQEIDFLRARLNARIYTESEPWMLPSWVHLTLRDIDLDEKLITELSNSSYNNWSNIGGVGASRFGIVDSRGLLTTGFDCGSVDFWLLDTDSLIFPALLGNDDSQLRLVSSEDQLYEWKKYLGSVEFNRLIYHVQKNDAEFVYNEVVLRNHGLEEVTITFFVTVRPMSVLGFEPIERVEYNSEKRAVFTNDYLSILLAKEPTAVIVGENCDHELPTILQDSEQDSGYELRSPKGQAMILLKYEITLPPAGSENIFFVSPLASYTKENTLPSVDPSISDRDVSIGNWFSFTDNRVKTMFPEDVFDHAFSQATVTLVIQALSVLFPEDSFLASQNWRERMRILLALLRSGCTTVTEKLTSDILERIPIPDGPLDTSIFSPILWGVLQLSEHTSDGFAKKNVDSIGKLTDGIIKSVRDQQQPTQEEELLHGYNMLTETMFDEIIQQHWDIACLESARALFISLNDEAMTKKLTELLADSDSRLNGSYDEISQARWPKPTDPMMYHIDEKALELISTVSLLGVTATNNTFLDQLSEQISERRIIKKLWKSVHPKERYSSHLALRLAHFYTRNKQRDRAESLLRRTLEFLTSDYLLPEYVNIKSYGGCEGVGASIIAAADLILLIHDMLVMEDEGNLVVLPGIPEEWFTAKKPLVVEDLPTRLGFVQIAIGSSANQHQLEIVVENLPDELNFHVPPSVPMPMVKAYGSSIVERVSKVVSPFLRVVPHSNEVVLTFYK